MDDKTYTCFYCHSILPYEVCISGTHFCLQATNAIEFWGNVVKIASTNSVEEQDGEASVDQEPTFKQEHEDVSTVQPGQIEDPDVTAFPEMDCEDPIQDAKHLTKTDESIIDSQDVESDGVKPMNWRLKMIALVKQRPPLYDKRLPLTERTFPIRARLWKEVYDGLNGLVPIDLLPKRFKVLRDRYNKEVKRRKLGHPPRKPWSLFKYLDFLSHAKKKVCFRKMSLVNGEIKTDITVECEDKNVFEKLMCPDKANLTDDDSYKENLEMKKRLVQLVGDRPPLYDCRLPRPVRIAENKVKLWREVYEALNGAIPLVDLPRKFKSLRDRYMKEKKKGDGAGSEGGTPWPLMEHMAYLEDVAFIRSQELGSPLHQPPAASQSPTTLMDEKKGSEERVSMEDVEETMEALHGGPAMSPMDNVSPLPANQHDNLDIIVPDNIENHKDIENSEVLLTPFTAKSQDGSLLNLTSLKNGTTPSLLASVKGKGVQDLGISKMKKLELLEAFESWTEDDFFGAYLVKLMKKLPLDERLRLHVDIINMITQSIKNQQPVT